MVPTFSRTIEAGRVDKGDKDEEVLDRNLADVDVRLSTKPKTEIR